MPSPDDSLALLGGLVLDDGSRWGDVASAHQRADARAVLDTNGPLLHFQTRPRGGSKTTDEAGVALAALLDQAPAASRSYAVAVDADQAGLLHDACAGFVARTPRFDQLLEVRARSVINRATGASLEVLAGDGASAWGLRPYLMIVDELAAWPATTNHRRLWEALVSAQPKTRGRLVCLTSAGDPAHWSHRVLEGAKASGCWRVSEMPGPVPWQSAEDLAELRRMLPESSYARLVLNEWTAPEDRLTTIDAVRDCVGHAGVLPPAKGVDYVVSLDVGLTNDRTVVAVGHLRRRDDGSHVVVVDRLEVRQGRKGAEVNLGEVEDLIVELSGLYGGARVVFDPYQAVHIAQGLRHRRVKANPFTFSASSVGRLGLMLYRLLRDRLLDLPDDDELLDELASVRLRETTPGSYRLDHDSGKHDDRAVAIALLAHELLEHKRKRRRSIASSAAMSVGMSR